MNGLTQHLESFLGEIDIGWKDADGSKWPFFVLRFTGGTIANTITYSTLGLSDTPLFSATSRKNIRHELIMMTRASFADRGTPTILQQVGMEAITSARPYLRGDVIGPRGKLFEDTVM